MSVADNASLALTMDPTTLTVSVLPRRAPQLWPRAFRRFQLLHTIDPDDSNTLWPASTLEPLHVYLLDSFKPPPPLCDRYLNKHARFQRRLLGLLQADLAKHRPSALRQHRNFLRRLYAPPLVLPLQMFHRQALRLHFSLTATDVPLGRGHHQIGPQHPTLVRPPHLDSLRPPTPIQNPTIPQNPCHLSPPKSYGISPCFQLSRPLAHALHHVRRLASSSMSTQLPLSSARPGAAAIKPCAARVYQRPFAST